MEPTPNEFPIRRLTAQDLPLARALNVVFGEAFFEPDTYQGATPSDAYLAAVLGRPHVVVLVALDGERVVGGLVAYVLEKLEQARSEVYLYDLAVAATVRRRGIARRLIAELQAIAGRSGAWVVFVQADPGDEAAEKLYESLGTREAVYHYDLAPR